MVKKNNVAWQNLDCETVYILNETNGEEILLTGIAEEIWKFLCEGMKTEEIIETLSEEYVDDNVAKDVLEFVCSLKEQNILE